MAEHYDVYGHDSFWKNLQRNGIVPPDVEYDEVPRGRVDYDRNENKFHVYVDPCIFFDRKALDEIDRDFHLFPPTPRNQSAIRNTAVPAASGRSDERARRAGNGDVIA
jgi:hypothetical protein